MSNLPDYRFRTSERNVIKKMMRTEKDRRPLVDNRPDHGSGSEY